MCHTSSIRRALGAASRALRVTLFSSAKTSLLWLPLVLPRHKSEPIQIPYKSWQDQTRPTRPTRPGHTMTPEFLVPLFLAKISICMKVWKGESVQAKYECLKEWKYASTQLCRYTSMQCQRYKGRSANLPCIKEPYYGKVHLVSHGQRPTDLLLH